MVLLRECGDKLGSARMEGQAFGPEKPPVPGCLPFTSASFRERKGPSRSVSSRSLLPGREGHTVWKGAML